MRRVPAGTISDQWTVTPDITTVVQCGKPVALVVWPGASTKCQETDRGVCTRGWAVAMVRLVITNNNSSHDFVSQLTPDAVLAYLRQQHAQQGDYWFSAPYGVSLPCVDTAGALTVPPRPANVRLLPCRAPCIFVPPGAGSIVSDIYVGDGIQRRGNRAYVHVYYDPFDLVGALGHLVPNTADNVEITDAERGLVVSTDFAQPITYLGNTIEPNNIVVVRKRRRRLNQAIAAGGVDGAAVVVGRNGRTEAAVVV